MRVRAHTCYLGKTGFAAHARSFFRELSKHVDLRVRNFTWDNNPGEYLNDIDLEIVDQISLGGPDGKLSDYNITRGFKQFNWKHTNEEDSRDFNQDVDIVLVDINHHYFYQEYKAKVKIAYTVWESTLLPQGFFDRLKNSFDYLWVVSKWHKTVAIQQGYPAERIFVVNEGVDEVFYMPKETHTGGSITEYKQPDEYSDDRFKFLFFGRWDYRKSVPEILSAFLAEFSEDEPVDLILSADNPFSVDGLTSTEQRLEHYAFTSDKIKVKHFVSREDYIRYMKYGHVFISCARSEGWNIPLIEAMAAGTPAIYSNWGAQLEFAEGKGLPVAVVGEAAASIGAKLGFAGDTPGNYANPDFADLRKVLRDAYVNYKDHKKKAVNDARIIVENFNWSMPAKQALTHLNSLTFVEHLTTTVKTKSEAVVVMSHADNEAKQTLLRNCVSALSSQGYCVIVSSHIPIPVEISNIVDFVVIDKDNPVVYSKDFKKYSDNQPIFYFKSPDYEINYAFEFNHGYAALKLIKNGAAIAATHKYERTHFVNYDYVLNNSDTLNKLNSSLRVNANSSLKTVSSFYWGTDELSFNTGLFSTYTKQFLDAISEIDSIEAYFKGQDSVILENVLYNVLKNQEFTYKLSKPEELHKDSGNIINATILSTKNSVEIGGNTDALLALAMESRTREYFLIAMGGKSGALTISIKFNGQDKTIEALPYPARFIHIPTEIVKKGFDVLIHNSNETRRFDSNTQLASCTIKNPKIRVNVLDAPNTVVSEELIFNFEQGPYFEVKGSGDQMYQVEFIDRDNNDQVVYVDVFGVNHWARCNRKYYVNWKIRVTNLSTNEVREEVFDCTNKTVLVMCDSSSLGDSIAWFPHVEEFRKKHNCNLYYAGFKNELFEANYPNIKFVKPSTQIKNPYVVYKLGWYYGEDGKFDGCMHPKEFKNIPMQQTVTDILGLPYTQLKPNLVIQPSVSPIEGKYVCIGIHSTTQAKYWNNPTGWQEVVDHLLDLGYTVINLSTEENPYMGNKQPKGVMNVAGKRSLNQTIQYLQHAEMFIGLGSGLSWLSWAVGTPTVIISGFSKPYSEFIDDKVIRIFKGGVCNGCFNRERLDAGDWNWCPDHKGTHRQFECSKYITGEEVINEIDKFLVTKVASKTTEVVIDESYYLGMVQNHEEILEAAEFLRKQNIVNFMEIGTDQGGTFAIWSKISAADGKRISVDLPHGEFGRMDFDVIKRDFYLKTLGSDVTMIHGSSHDEGIYDTVVGLIGGTLLDFLFIDGDHTYEGVKQDYEMYKGFVKKGGFIGFHDIKDTQFHRDANCRVDQLWNELEGTKYEFVDNSSEYGGIGIIQVN